MKRHSVIPIIVFIIAIIGCHVSHFEGYSLSLTGEEAVSRFDCLSAILSRVGITETQALSETLICYYDGFPLKDLHSGKEDGFAMVGYKEKVTYGKYITEAEVEELERIAKDRYQKFVEEKGYDAETIFRYDEESKQFYDETGNVVPAEVLSLRYMSGALFCGNDPTTVQECIAFMIRCIKEDESFKSLANTWAYAKEIGLILESDMFYDTPESDLTQEDFDLLLDRFSKCDFERTWVQ